MGRGVRASLPDPEVWPPCPGPEARSGDLGGFKTGRDKAQSSQGLAQVRHACWTLADCTWKLPSCPSWYNLGRTW